MCGIFGVVESGLFPLPPEPTTALLWRGIGALHHRGPDGAGVFLDGPCGLAHARLSVVDLAGGAQPMRSRDGTLAVTFNGEIFNHLELRAELEAHGRIFASRSDTEVILQAYAHWGDACVDRFNGQWAFALWDKARRRLFCARDRVGVRPFFWAEHAGRFTFASEAKALFAAGVPRALDVAGLHDVLTFWCPRAPRTAWQGVRELPPGHTLVVDARGLAVRQVWSLEAQPAPGRSDADEAADVLRVLDDATRLRLRADVPVGAYLSGGLDSSLVAGLVAHRTDAHLHTYSVTFAAQDYDESVHQREVAAALGTQHHTVRCADDDIGQTFADVMWHVEVPVMRSSPAPFFHLARLVRDSGLKVVLTGEGADEMFGGYDIFKEAKIRRFCARAPSSTMRPMLLRRLYPWMQRLQAQPSAYLQAFFQANAHELDDPLFSHLPRWRLTQQLMGLLAPDVRAVLDERDPLEQLRADLPAAFMGWDPLTRAQWLESTILLPGFILSSQGDRMAMAHGVEGRFPFLDAHVLERAARLPAQQLLRVLEEKAVLKRAARGLVPPSVLARPKQPYRAPDAQGFFTARAGGWRAPDVVEDLLLPGHVRSMGLFDAPAVGRLVDKARRGAALSARDNMAFVFVVSTLLLLESYGASFPSSLERHRRWTPQSLQPRSQDDVRAPHHTQAHAP